MSKKEKINVIAEDKTGWTISGKPLVGRIFDTQVKGTLGEDGTWEVMLVNRESVTTDGENWEDETIAFKSLDTSFGSAHETVLRAYISWMQDNVYDKGLDSLILAVRALKEPSDGNDSKTDETP